MLKICFYTNFVKKMRKSCENAILARFLACPGFFFQANPPKLMDSLNILVLLSQKVITELNPLR